MIPWIPTDLTTRSIVQKKHRVWQAQKSRVNEVSVQICKDGYPTNSATLNKLPNPQILADATELKF